MLAKVSTFLGPNSFYSTVGTPSLVLSLDAAGYTSSGTWSDLSNLNNDATPNGSISWSSDGGGSFEFNGIDSYFGFSNPVAIPLGNSKYTIETWFKSNSFGPSEQGPLVAWGTPFVPNHTNVLRLNDNGFINYWWANDLYAYFSGSQSLYVDNWYYVVATYDGTHRKIYLNGEQVALDTPLTPPSVNNSSNLKVGFDELNYFDGKISKVKIHSKALSSERISSNFNSDKIRHGYEYGSMVFSSSSSSNLSSSSDDYVLTTNDFTIEAFFYPQLSTYDYGGIVSTRTLGQIDVAINTVQNNTSTPLIEFDAGGVYLTYTASNDEWYHAAISRIGGTTSFYVNGNLFTEISDNTDYTNNQIAIGKYYTNYDSYYFNGLISNVRVINGTGLYSGSSFTIPSTPLEWLPDTKLLITSQKTSPTIDVSGNLQVMSASNIGWTSSSPVLDLSYFNYPDFSITTGLNLLQYNAIVSNQIRLTALVNSQVGNIWTSTSTNYNRNFSLEWNFECSGGSGADGFCIQWLNNNSTTGGAGGDVGAVYSSIVIFQFKTYSNNSITQYQNGSNITTQSNTMSFRQNLYYWFDYNFATSTVYIRYATSYVKPISPIHTFTSVVFDSSNYYFGVGAANGGSNDYHTLKSMKLTFT